MSEQNGQSPAEQAQNTEQPKKERPKMVSREKFAKIAIRISANVDMIERDQMTAPELAKQLTDTLGFYVHPTTAKQAAIVAEVKLTEKAKPVGKLAAMQEKIATLERALAAATDIPQVVPPTRTNRVAVRANSAGMVPAG